MEASRQQNVTFNMRKHQCQPKGLHPVKLSFEKIRQSKSEKKLNTKGDFFQEKENNLTSKSRIAGKKIILESINMWASIKDHSLFKEYC